MRYVCHASSSEVGLCTACVTVMPGDLAICSSEVALGDGLCTACATAARPDLMTYTSEVANDCDSDLMTCTSEV